MLQDSALPQRVRHRALAVFEALAQAEASVHGVDVEAVHFHEVGAVDSIVDIVAACVGLELLGITQIVSGCPPLSSGEVQGAHGRIPLFNVHRPAGQTQDVAPLPHQGMMTH